jgi:GAF domain-containing protein
MRPLSARAKFCSQPASASEDQERARVDDAAHKERQAWARERPAQPPEAAGRTCATSDGGGDSGGDGPIGLGNRHSNKPQEVVVAASTPDNWKQCFHAGALVKIIQDLCSLGQSSKTNDAIQSTRGLVQRSLDCEGCSVFLVQGEKGLICNSISAPALPKSMGVVSRVAQGLAASINVSNENKCDFFDERIDRDPDLKIRVGKGLLAQGVFSSCGKVVGVILAVGKVRGPSFDTTDEGILKAIAIQVGMILGLCKTARKMEGKFHEGERDKRFAKALNDCKTSSSVQVLVQQYVKELTDATSVEFFTAEVFARVQSMDGSDDPVTHENHPVDTATRAFRSGRAFVIEDLSVHDQYRHLRRQHNFARSVMSIPMRVGPNGKILGVIQARNDDAFKFSHHQAEQMEPMLFMMTKELERIMMWDNTLKLQKRLPLVFTAREIFGTLFVAEDVAREVLNAKSACVYVFNQTSNRIWTAHPTSSERDEFDADLGIVGDCLRRNELMQVSNALHDARYFEPIDGNKCMDLGTHHRHMLLAPIRALKDKRLLGVLVISRDQSQSFSNIDETFAKVIAITLAAAFEVCMEHEIYEVALKDNRTIMRLAATMQHNNRIPDLAQATILGTLEAMQASECIVLLKPEANERIQAFKEEEDISKVKLRKFSLFDGQLEEDIVQWDDAVIEQSILKGRMVNVTSQRMLNAIGYKRLHRSCSLSHFPFRCALISLPTSLPLPLGIVCNHPFSTSFAASLKKHFRLSAISGAHSLPSQLDRQPDELLLGPTMCTPLFTGLDQGQVFGAIQIRRPVKAAGKFEWVCTGILAGISSSRVCRQVEANVILMHVCFFSFHRE